MLFANLAGMTVSFSTQPLVQLFGGGDQARGFFYVACVLALVASCIFPIVYFATREPTPTHDEPIPRLRDYWVTLRHNRAFWIVVLACWAARSRPRRSARPSSTISSISRRGSERALCADREDRTCDPNRLGLGLHHAIRRQTPRLVFDDGMGMRRPDWFYFTDADHGHCLRRCSSYSCTCAPWGSTSPTGRCSRTPSSSANGAQACALNRWSLASQFSVRRRRWDIAAGLLGVALDFVGFVPNATADAGNPSRNEDDHHPATACRHGDRRRRDVLLPLAAGSTRKDRRGAGSPAGGRCVNCLAVSHWQGAGGRVARRCGAGSDNNF